MLAKSICSMVSFSLHIDSFLSVVVWDFLPLIFVRLFSFVFVLHSFYAMRT